eukprot:TRINITY_DN6203_c0_g4_i5.p2 TRINITY_DN6203_c0_g4~~TRINITY_DN6203_c0_g4_i5.p2  ORF type:complete len:142 (-),score=4.98 TRINITY_DN6203_c0_g4_i5:14-439(-)
MVFQDMLQMRQAAQLNSQFLTFPGLIGERFFVLFDIDKDGHLKKTEFESCICRLFDTLFLEKVKLVFDLFDFDSDGRISKEDIRTLLSHIPPVQIMEVTNVAVPQEGQVLKKKSSMQETPVKQFVQETCFLRPSPKPTRTC